jgi:hypothetical protein
MAEAGLAWLAADLTAVRKDVGINRAFRRPIPQLVGRTTSPEPPTNELDILTEALNRTDPAERAMILDQACAGNSELRSRRAAEHIAGLSRLKPCYAGKTQITDRSLEILFLAKGLILKSVGATRRLLNFLSRRPRLGIRAVAATRKQPVDRNSTLATELPLEKLVPKHYCPCPAGIS